MKDPRRALHPALRAWFDARFASLSSIQREALPHTLAGKSTLILAPTGSGKTLSAFLACLSRLAALAESGQLTNAVHVVYVSPLKSLDRDIHRNLTEPLAAINTHLPEAARIRMEVRTGDTEPLERSRQQRHRPHLLLTTSESLSALLSQRMWADGFSADTLIVDEIHSFAENKRGLLLALTAERLEAKSGKLLQRIGLSATAWPVEVIVKLLCGERPCAVASVDVRKAHSLDIETGPAERSLPPAGYNPYRIAHTVADLVQAARCTLIFVSTRSAAERLGLALRVLLPDDEALIAVHHSAVDMAERLAIENGLAEGTLKAVVCSTSLELGVDFQAVDQVVLAGTPRGISRALQRLGRSGHRVDGVASGAIVPLSLPDVLQALALRHAASVGRMDALKMPVNALDVVAQALLGMSIERRWSVSEAHQLIRRAGPYLDFSRDDLESVLNYLAGGGTVLAAYGTYGKIVREGDGFNVASRTVARDYYMNVGTISDDFSVKVVTRSNRRLGEVEERFLSALQPGEAFTIGGKAVVVESLYQDIAVVRPAAGERVQTPRWMGGKMPLTARLAAEEVQLRADLRAAWDTGGRTACAKVLRRNWNVSPAVIDRILLFLERQSHAAPIPTAHPVQIERVREGRSLVILFHSVAGRAVNRSLAWVVGYRLGVKGSIVANHDDHAFLLSVGRKDAPDEQSLRRAFDPGGLRDDLRTTLEGTDLLGRGFRSVAETGQLLPRRTWKGQRSAKQSSWSASLLYRTLREHEPEHPLLRETVRDVMENQMDVANAEAHAARIFEAPWEIYDLPRPSPFALPLFAAFSRETLLAQDPDRALDELVAALYEQWESERVASA